MASTRWIGQPYSELPPAAFENRVVLDAMNFDPSRDTAVAAQITPQTPPAVLLQQHLPAARIVKVFSNIFARHIQLLARRAGSADRSALPIAGDVPDAKAAVAALLDRRAGTRSTPATSPRVPVSISACLRSSSLTSAMPPASGFSDWRQTLASPSMPKPCVRSSDTPGVRTRRARGLVAAVRTIGVRSGRGEPGY
jgi:hypothetical protein